MRAILSTVVTFGFVSHLAAQGPIVPPPKTPPTQPAMRERQVAVTVEGCIRDRRLKIAQDSASSSFSVKALEVTEFTLDGPKELLQQLKSNHNDHQDLVTGITIVPDTRTDDDLTSTIEVGKKTRINAGSSNNTESNPVVARSKILNLRVTSIKHLANRCSI